MTHSTLSNSTQSRPATDPRPRLLSEADCRDIAARLARYAKGGGETHLAIGSSWFGSVAWGRNRITTTSEDRDNKLRLRRLIKGAAGEVELNDVSDPALVAALRRAERLINLDMEHVDADAIGRPGSLLRPEDEPVASPSLFFDTTYQLDAGRRAETARQFIQSAADAGMLSAGRIGVSARSFAYISSWGYTKYLQYTWAQYSVTVRDAKGTGSGWAGVDWPDWNKIDGAALSKRALEKCLATRNPVRVEPGRYTAILEPQAVGDLIGPMMFWDDINRQGNETSQGTAFHKFGEREPLERANRPIGYSRVGERVVDERITISSDPMDPTLGFPAIGNVFSWSAPIAPAYHPAVWIERGVLKNLSYDRNYGIRHLGNETGLPNAGAFRISVTGATSTIEEMIASTKRGLLVTRFDGVNELASQSLLCRGYTRDGVWLIEDGKITHPAKNFMFTESPLFVLNNIDLVGVPQRIFHPITDWKPASLFVSPQPIIAPALKVRDFSFTSLSDAI